MMEEREAQEEEGGGGGGGGGGGRERGRERERELWQIQGRDGEGHLERCDEEVMVERR